MRVLGEQREAHHAGLAPFRPGFRQVQAGELGAGIGAALAIVVRAEEAEGEEPGNLLQRLVQPRLVGTSRLAPLGQAAGLLGQQPQRQARRLGEAIGIEPRATQRPVQPLERAGPGEDAGEEAQFSSSMPAAAALTAARLRLRRAAAHRLSASTVTEKAMAT